MTRTTPDDPDTEPMASTASPLVDATIAKVMKRYPTDSKAYYEAVHQELAPLARKLEADLAAAHTQRDTLQQQLALAYRLSQSARKALAAHHGSHPNTQGDAFEQLDSDLKGFLIAQHPNPASPST